MRKSIRTSKKDEFYLPWKGSILKNEPVIYQALYFARVVELVDTLDLGSSALTGVGVRVPPLVHPT